MGFTKITARGVDLAETQVRRARLLARNRSSVCDVSLRFEVGDVRARFVETDKSVDVCLCLYGVLNHSPVKDLPALLREVARVTRGRFIATVRAIRSTPSIYVDSVKAATASRQDHSRGKLNGEFLDGTQKFFSSHLFSAAEIQALAEPALVIDDMCGLDLFHGRFARDPQWNPAKAQPSGSFLNALRDLEHRYSRDPSFVDHATHLLMVAHARLEADGSRT